MSDVESPVVGKYSNIEVKVDTCIIGGIEKPIQWINEYAFYLPWAPGNDQIWVYDTIRNCLYQMYNNLPAGILNRPSTKFGDTKEEYFEMDNELLGFYDGVTIYKTCWLNKYGDMRPIAWLNPYACYSKWADGNEQIWVFQANKNGFYQLFTGGPTSVTTAYNKGQYYYRRV